MDPSAPNNSSNPNQGTPEPTNPIEPGQFVVSAEEPVTPQNPPPQVTQQTPAYQVPPESQKLPVSREPQPNIAQNQSQAPAAVPPQPPPSPPSQTPGAPAPNFSQPDPTPFSPPAPAGVNPDGESKTGKLKLILIVLGLLVLLATVGGLLWFFVLGKRIQEATKTENPEDSVAVEEEPSPITKRTTGGFGELPSATAGAPLLTASPEPGSEESLLEDESLTTF